MKRCAWLLVTLLVALSLPAGCGRSHLGASTPPAPTRPATRATVASADRSETIADDLDKSLGEMENSLSGVDTIEDLEQALQGS